MTFIEDIAQRQLALDLAGARRLNHGQRVIGDDDAGPPGATDAALDVRGMGYHDGHSGALGFLVEAIPDLRGKVGDAKHIRGQKTGYRGERLKIIDPGIVPERPSSPNVPLNLAAALLLGLVLPILYLAIELNFQERRAIGRLDRFHAVAKGRDD